MSLRSQLNSPRPLVGVCLVSMLTALPIMVSGAIPEPSPGRANLSAGAAMPPPSRIELAIDTPEDDVGFAGYRRASEVPTELPDDERVAPTPTGPSSAVETRAATASDRPRSLIERSPVEKGQATAPATRVDPPAFARPITSPNVGARCASGLGAAALTAFFAHPIGAFQGADYQRAFRLPDDRVLWTFQDAFVNGALVHNVGMIQSGRCFTMLNAGTRSWLFAGSTAHMRQWHWILDGGLGADGRTFHLFVVQMNETGSRYLSRTRPTELRRVVLDISTQAVLEVIDEPPTGDDLFGWSVTQDARYTYLYSHCYQQFGYDTPLGFAPCAAEVKLARVPLGRFGAAREYWTGNGWSPEHARAVPVVDGRFALSGNNPAQVRFDGTRFVLVEKRDDWWGRTVEFGVADRPQGPFHRVLSIDEPRKCNRAVCNTYFAAWVPWHDEAGRHIWSIGHNRWDGSTTHLHLETYRPTFDTVDL
jgi:hypothetical protein